MGEHNRRSDDSEPIVALWRDLWRRMTFAEKVADQRASIIVAQRREIERLREKVERLQAGR